MAVTDWKDTTGRSLPEDLAWFRLTGQIAIPTADSADVDPAPDLVEPFGSIILSPKLSETRFIGTANADPLTIALVDVPIKMNRAGQLFVVDGEAGARILNTSDPKLNPTNIPYTVRFEFEDIDDVVKPRIEPFDILPPPPREDGEPWVLDITQLATVAVTGQPVSVEMARSLAASAWNSARSAEVAATLARTTSVEAAGSAEKSRIASETARSEAQSARTAAVEAAGSAKESKTQATESAKSAEESKNQAVASAKSAKEAAEHSIGARKAAETSETQATAAARDASAAAEDLKTVRELVANTPIEFGWESSVSQEGRRQVKGFWRRKGEKDWKLIGTITSGLDGVSVTGAEVSAEGDLKLIFSKGEPLSVGRVVGPAPVMEAGEFTTTTDGSRGIEMIKTGEGKYALSLRMPPPDGVSRELVAQMVDSGLAEKVKDVSARLAEIEVLAMAGL